MRCRSATYLAYIFYEGKNYSKTEKFSDLRVRQDRGDFVKKKYTCDSVIIQKPELL